MSDNAKSLIRQLDLSPHPEGGWYRETWRGPPLRDGGRASGTAILFLLKAGERSHWHTVDADELWLWQGGDPLDLRLANSDAGPVETRRLGSEIGKGQELQVLVGANIWQAAEALAPDQSEHGYTLVSCVVVPGFEFEGFQLAPQGWEPAA